MAVAGPVGIRIRGQRKAMGLTQAELARRVGISASYLNLIEADKRAVGGSLLQQIAGELGVDLDILSGMQERRLVERLSEVAAQPELLEHGIDPSSANRFVSRHPEWARAMLGLWRAHRDSEQHISALADRLDQDPTLAEAVHDMLTSATAIRSTSEVLDTVDDLTGDERDRFIDIILSHSGALSSQAEVLVKLFETGAARRTSRTPAEEVDDLYIQNRAWFPELEEAVEDLRSEFGLPDRIDDDELYRALGERLGIEVRTLPADAAGRFRNSARFDPEAGRLDLLTTAPAATRRFQLARALVIRAQPDCADGVLVSDILTTDAARQRARSALYSAAAASLLMPYDLFLADAEALRYDIEALRQRHAASLEQVCLRLLSLKKPGAEGVPFALMKTDPSGFISKRYPLPGLPLPRSGSACPLWPLYAAFQTPERMIRQLAEFPNGSRFLFIARTVRHEPAAYHEAPFSSSIMLACDVAYADQTIYADGMNLSSQRIATPVGPACRLCPRGACAHRGESSFLASQNL
ncbi:MAG: helix-turn-helix domain-containing protein [Minwuia sp.]|uniref:helix-turn-helix domain-containing protein n=1 Tax=Minwuia sp. TaxID=2493630 RepID=UPI003A8C7E0B